MDNITALGLIAASLTTISFFPQVVKTLRSKDTKSISLPMYLIFCIGVFLWTVYGFLIWDLPILIGNLVTLTLASVILFMKIKNG